GMSGTHTVRCRASASMLHSQCNQLPCPPCSSTSGSPWPRRRQRTVPAGPAGTSTRSTRASSRAISGCTVTYAGGFPALHLDDVDAGGRRKAKLAGGQRRIGLDVGQLDPRGLTESIQQFYPHGQVVFHAEIGRAHV